MNVIKSLETRRVLSKETFAKIIFQETWLLSLLDPLMRVGLPLMKNILMLLVKNVFVPLEFKGSSVNHRCSCSKEKFWIGMCHSDIARQSTLITLNEEIRIIIEIVKFLEQFRVLINSASEIIKSEAVEQEFGFFSKLLNILSISLLESILADKGVIRAGEGVVEAGKRTIRAGSRVVSRN